MTAQGLTLRHADRVAATVMANTTAFCSDDFRAAFDQRVAAVADGGMEAVVESTIERWFSESYRASGAERLDDVRTHDPHHLGRGIHGLCAGYPGLAYLDRLSSLDHPVLLIAGTQDAATPPAGMRLMHERIKGSRMSSSTPPISRTSSRRRPSPPH